MQEHVGVSFGHIELRPSHVHRSADGKRYLLIHGDEFDQITKYHRWLAVLGDRAYELVIRLNALLSLLRRRLGVIGYWSLSGYAKRKVKRAVSLIFDFEEAVARYVKERNVDGVTCGHIHAVAIKENQGIQYINCRDWVDSCTAIVERTNTRMELVEWGVRAEAAEEQATPLPFPAPETPVVMLEKQHDPSHPRRIRAAGADR